ncbi:MAG: Lon protease [Bifidobacteriaceae bacterium]|nr:Lon protease [Bifidobacteriaceae bacterium]
MSEKSHDDDANSLTAARNSERTIRRGPLAWARDVVHGRMSARYLMGAVFAALCVVALCIPSPYALRYPGGTLNVLGDVTDQGTSKKVIDIEGAPTYDDSGKLLMTTVLVAGAVSPAQNWEALAAYVNKDSVIMPREAVVPYGTSSDDYESQSTDQMTSAEDSASTNAIQYVSAHNLVAGFDASAVHITVTPGDVGGPSAGLMYTLGIIDKLTPQSESGGLTIAGTGTMESDGTVGAIGGIRQKMIGAKRDGATWFLAPATNCDEVVGHVPDGMRDVAVANLDEAYQALVAIGSGDTDGLQQCTAQIYEQATAAASASESASSASESASDSSSSSSSSSSAS